jgi:hypothetical protein
MWNATIESRSPTCRRYFLSQQGQSLSYRRVLQGWQGDEVFRRYFQSLLVEAPFTAFRWETPAVDQVTIDQIFEFVLLDDPLLNRRVDRAAFAEHFRPQTPVATFANLGGDAVLVVPCPLADDPAYVHLASFVRQVPETQVHALWQAVAAAMNERIDDRPVWLSTAGAGVAWLHVRLDDRPKYYGHAAYRARPASK